MPEKPLLIREIFPSETDDFREGAVIGLDLARDVLPFDEGGAEEDERIRGAWNMIFRLLLAVGSLARGGCVFLVGGTEDEVAIDQRRGPIIKIDRRRIRQESNSVGINIGRFDRNSPY